MTTTPKDGWVVELKEAKRAAKKLSKRHSRSKNNTERSNDSNHDEKYLNELRIDAQLRIATAHHKLRQFQACKAAVAVCQSMKPTHYADIQTLKKYEADADAYVKTSKLFERNQDALSENIHKLMSGEKFIDHIALPHIAIANLNILQCCALSGDVNTMERAIAHGASLDCPLIPKEAFSLTEMLGGLPESMAMLPTDNTALVLVCANLVVNCHMKLFVFDIETTMQVISHLEECTVQLIMLGADVDRKLHLSSASRDGSEDYYCRFWRKLKLDGKTAREMIILSKNQRAIDATNAMKTDELKIDNAHCRCGSRLKWSECHANGVDKERHCVRSDRDGNKLLFRHSPLARCECEKTCKTYYDCCWKFGRIQYFLDDASGQIMCHTCGTMPVEFMLNRCNLNEMEDLPLGPGTSLCTEMSEDARDDFRAGKCPKELLEQMQIAWPLFCRLIPSEQIGKSGLDSFDPAVYTGCISRINNFFFWTNAHWMLEESELLVRVIEWNEALNLYCDDHNMTGATRSRVYERHKAFQFAPCGNRSCNRIEKKVKSFHLCSGCKKIAYCGRQCQKDDWKRHKRECGQYGTSPSQISDMFQALGFM